MIVQDEIHLEFASPLHDLVQEIQEQRVQCIVRRSGRHIMQIDGQPDHIAAQAPDLLKIGFGIACKLDGMGRPGLKPTGQIDTTGEIGRLCKKSSRNSCYQKAQETASCRSHRVMV